MRSAGPAPAPAFSGDDWHPETTSSATTANLFIPSSPLERPALYNAVLGLAQIFQQLRGAGVLGIDLERFPAGGARVVEALETHEAKGPLDVGGRQIGPHQRHLGPELLGFEVVLVDLSRAREPGRGVEGLRIEGAR